jgi:hypothetical protein
LPRQHGCFRPHNTLLPLRWNEPVVRTILASGSRMQRLVAVVGADDLKWISGYISIKEAHSPALWWHQDWWCWDHPFSYRRTTAQIAVLCYVSDTNEQNGALRILRGSHLRSTPLHAILPEAHSQAADALAPDDPVLSDVSEQTTIAVKARDAVAIDYRLLHGTHPNNSNAGRDCILLSFAPSWSSLPEDIRAHLISHPALPTQGETPPRAMAPLLPCFGGTRRDLRLNRNAPFEFETSLQ